MPKHTKERIMTVCLNLLEEKSLDKIKVKDIVERCELNRNTFYYYYSDIYAVLDDIFQTEIENALNQSSRDCNFYDAYMNSGSLIVKHKKALIHVFNSKSRDVMLNYLYISTKNFVKYYVVQYDPIAELSEVQLDYICNFYCYFILGNIVQMLTTNNENKVDDFIHQASETFQITIASLIEQAKNNL